VDTSTNVYLREISRTETNTPATAAAPWMNFKVLLAVAADKFAVTATDGTQHRVARPGRVQCTPLCVPPFSGTDSRRRGKRGPSFTRLSYNKRPRPRLNDLGFSWAYLLDQITRRYEMAKNEGDTERAKELRMFIQIAKRRVDGHQPTKF
jgi:hypothetical protein